MIFLDLQVMYIEEMYDGFLRLLNIFSMFIVPIQFIFIAQQDELTKDMYQTYSNL